MNRLLRHPLIVALLAFPLVAHSLAAKEAAPVNDVASHTLTVEGGKGSGTHATKQKVTVFADSPPAGKFFDHWTAPETLKLKKVDHSTFVLEMPDADVTLKANYADIASSTLIRV